MRDMLVLGAKRAELRPKSNCMRVHIPILPIAAMAFCLIGPTAIAEDGAEVDSDWWAFQPRTSPEVPSVDSDWPRNEIDRFILRELSAHDIPPAPEASKEVLVRRAYFDLIGLPPTPEEIDAFLNDESPDAWDRLIDKLLDDPRYGEHWARFWLDLVRYAESDGWNKDSYRPNIWRYRDYVVDAFNNDKPYPQFVMEQLAGDEISADDPEDLIATGFLRLGIYEYNQRDAKPHWNDIMNEITDVSGNVFFGLSISCSRCHDHKFDPIPRTDYFSLRAFFEPLIWRDDVPGGTQKEQKAFAEQQEVWKEATADIRAEIDELCAPYIKRKWDSTVDKFPLDIQACFNKPEAERTSWEHQMAYLVTRQFYEEGTPWIKSLSKEDKARYDELQEALAEFDDIKPKPLPSVMSVADFHGAISPTVVPNDPKKRAIAPAFLDVLEEGEAIDTPQLPESTGRRTALAEWIGRADNPLTTRVIVNRVWQQHFGEGIVSSANDFGHLGQPPTHPELLDWLTNAYIENGWSMKHLHRQILNSSTWRQSALHPDAETCQEKDPKEELRWRASVQRLTAEQIRDAMLAVSGELNTKIGGPSVDAKEPRRGLYVKRQRNSPDPFLHAFDTANGLTSTAQRVTTTTPMQSLMLINGDYTLGRAKLFAKRLADNDSTGVAIDYAFRAAWGRRADDDEHSNALAFLSADESTPVSEVNEDKLVDFCHALFNSNAFMYLD